MTKRTNWLLGIILFAVFCVCAPGLRAQDTAEQDEAKKALAAKKTQEVERAKIEAKLAGGDKTRNDILGTITDMATPKPQPRKKPKPIIVDVEKILGATEDKKPTVSLTVDEVLHQMEKMRKGLKTFTADVVKIVYTEPLDDTEIFRGQIQFKLPRLLRMRLVRKAKGRLKRKEVVYIVGKKLAFVWRVHDQQAEGVNLKDMKTKIKNSNPLEYGLSGDVREWRKTYKLKLLPAEKIGGEETAVLQMRPRGLPADETEGITTLWLSKNSWLPVQIREVKNDGDIIETHTFANLKRDVKIKDKVFEFEPDDEVDVIIHAPE